MRSLTRSLALVTALLATACPWRGVNDLISDTTVEIVVTGLAPGDELRLDLDGDLTTLTVSQGDGDRVSFYEALPPGEHDGALKLVHAEDGDDDARCLAFSFTTAAGERRSVAIDTSQLGECDDDDGEDPTDAGVEQESPTDAGVPQPQLERVREVVFDGSCDPEPCEQETRVEAGVIDVTSDDGELQATLSAQTWTDLQALLLSPAANTLFAGDDLACPLADPGEETTVELERRARIGGDEDAVVTERLDVTGCGGVAAQIRAALAAARAEADPGSEEEPDDAGP